MHRVKVLFMYHCDRFFGTKGAEKHLAFRSVRLTIANILRITRLFLHFDAFVAMNLIFMRLKTSVSAAAHKFMDFT